MSRQPSPHGTHSCYTAGCHCEPCRAANRDYKRSVRDRKRASILDDPQPCPECGRHFDGQQGVRIHLAQIHRIRIHECDQPGCTTPTDHGTLCYRHALQRRKGGTVACEECGDLLVSEHGLSIHRTKIHRTARAQEQEPAKPHLAPAPEPEPEPEPGRSDTSALNYLLDALDLPRLDWHDHAACRGPDVDPAWFWPERGASTRPAKEVCARCPVIDQCRDYILDDKRGDSWTRFGIWAGMSERERRRIRRERASGTNTISCSHCGTVFTPTRTNHHLCSTPCRDAYFNARRPSSEVAKPVTPQVSEVQG